MVPLVKALRTRTIVFAVINEAVEVVNCRVVNGISFGAWNDDDAVAVIQGAPVSASQHIWHSSELKGAWH